MEGYNPSVSLLPAGNGHITAMSGGSMDPPPGYNPSASLLPASSIPIPTFKGGADALALSSLPHNIGLKTIRNDGSQQPDFQNQCMLISLWDYIRYCKSQPITLGTTIEKSPGAEIDPKYLVYYQDSTKYTKTFAEFRNDINTALHMRQFNFLDAGATLDTLWPTNREYKYDGGYDWNKNPIDENDLQKKINIQQHILDTIAAMYVLRIYIRHIKYNGNAWELSAPILLSDHSNLLKDNDTTYINAVSNVEIVAFGNHFELLLRDNCDPDVDKRDLSAQLAAAPKPELTTSNKKNTNVKYNTQFNSIIKETVLNTQIDKLYNLQESIQQELTTLVANVNKGLTSSNKPNEKSLKETLQKIDGLHAIIVKIENKIQELLPNTSGIKPPEDKFFPSMSKTTIPAQPTSTSETETPGNYEHITQSSLVKRVTNYVKRDPSDKNKSNDDDFSAMGLSKYIDPIIKDDTHRAKLRDLFKKADGTIISSIPLSAIAIDPKYEPYRVLLRKMIEFASEHPYDPRKNKEYSVGDDNDFKPPKSPGPPGQPGQPGSGQPGSGQPGSGPPGPPGSKPLIILDSSILPPPPYNIPNIPKSPPTQINGDVVEGEEKGNEDAVPAVGEPDPAVAGPDPAVAGPDPAVAGPDPAVAGPDPAGAEPAPAVGEPAPAVGEPAPAVGEPAPAVAGPAPAVAGPAPAVAGPAENDNVGAIPAMFNAANQAAEDARLAAAEQRIQNRRAANNAAREVAKKHREDLLGVEQVRLAEEQARSAAHLAAQKAAEATEQRVRKQQMINDARYERIINLQRDAIDIMQRIRAAQQNCTLTTDTCLTRLQDINGYVEEARANFTAMNQQNRRPIGYQRAQTALANAEKAKTDAQSEYNRISRIEERIDAYVQQGNALNDSISDRAQINTAERSLQQLQTISTHVDDYIMQLRELEQNIQRQVTIARQSSENIVGESTLHNMGPNKNAVALANEIQKDKARLEEYSTNANKAITEIDTLEKEHQRYVNEIEQILRVVSDYEAKTDSGDPQNIPNNQSNIYKNEMIIQRAKEAIIKLKSDIDTNRALITTAVVNATQQKNAIQQHREDALRYNADVNGKPSDRLAAIKDAADRAELENSNVTSQHATVILLVERTKQIMADAREKQTDAKEAFDNEQRRAQHIEEERMQRNAKKQIIMKRKQTLAELFKNPIFDRLLRDGRLQQFLHNAPGVPNTPLKEFKIKLIDNTIATFLPNKPRPSKLQPLTPQQMQEDFKDLENAMEQTTTTPGLIPFARMLEEPDEKSEEHNVSPFEDPSFNFLDVYNGKPLTENDIGVLTRTLFPDSINDVEDDSLIATLAANAFAEFIARKPPTLVNASNSNNNNNNNGSNTDSNNGNSNNNKHRREVNEKAIHEIQSEFNTSYEEIQNLNTLINEGIGSLNEQYNEKHTPTITTIMNEMHVVLTNMEECKTSIDTNINSMNTSNLENHRDALEKCKNDANDALNKVKAFHNEVLNIVRNETQRNTIGTLRLDIDQISNEILELKDTVPKIRNNASTKKILLEIDPLRIRLEQLTKRIEATTSKLPIPDYLRLLDKIKVLQFTLNIIEIDIRLLRLSNINMSKNPTKSLLLSKKKLFEFQIQQILPAEEAKRVAAEKDRLEKERLAAEKARVEAERLAAEAEAARLKAETSLIPQPVIANPVVEEPDVSNNIVYDIHDSNNIGINLQNTHMQMHNAAKAAKRRAQEEADRRALEEATRVEAERKAAEAEADRIAQEEEAARVEADAAAVERARLEAERKAAERLAAEAAAAEAEREQLKREQTAAAERLAADAERERLEQLKREQTAAAERERLERLEREQAAARVEAEEAARLRQEAEEAARQKAEAARVEAERERLERERLEQLEREQAAAEAERKRLEQLEREQAAIEECAQIRNTILEHIKTIISGFDESDAYHKLYSGIYTRIKDMNFIQSDNTCKIITQNTYGSFMNLLDNIYILRGMIADGTYKIDITPAIDKLQELLYTSFKKYEPIGKHIALYFKLKNDVKTIETLHNKYINDTNSLRKTLRNYNNNLNNPRIRMSEQLLNDTKVIFRELEEIRKLILDTLKNPNDTKKEQIDTDLNHISGVYNTALELYKSIIQIISRYSTEIDSRKAAAETETARLQQEEAARLQEANAKRLQVEITTQIKEIGRLREEAAQLTEKTNTLLENLEEKTNTQLVAAQQLLDNTERLLNDAERLLNDANRKFAIQQIDNANRLFYDAKRNYLTIVKNQFIQINTILAEATRLQEETRQREEAARLQEETRQREEAARLQEETRQREEAARQQAQSNALGSENWRMRITPKKVNGTVPLPPSPSSALANLLAGNSGNSFNNMLQRLHHAKINISKNHQDVVLSEVENKLALVLPEEYEDIIHEILSVKLNRLSEQHKKRIDSKISDIATKRNKQIRILNPAEYKTFVTRISDLRNNKEEQQKVVDEYINTVMIPIEVPPPISRTPSYANMVRSQSPARPSSAAAAQPNIDISEPAMLALTKQIRNLSIRQLPLGKHTPEYKTMQTKINTLQGKLNAIHKQRIQKSAVAANTIKKSRGPPTTPLTVVAPVHDYVPENSRLTQKNRGTLTSARKTIQNAEVAMRERQIKQTNKTKLQKQINNAQTTINQLQERYPHIKIKGGKHHTIRRTIKRRYNRTHKK